MPNPTPIYRVSFNSQYLPGYVQTDEQPLSLRNIVNDMIGRDGASLYPAGIGLRKITLNFLILSRLGTASTGLEHLNDCKEQYRSALSYLTRITAPAPLLVGDQTRYVMASPSSITAPFEAGRSRRLAYSVTFDAQPWYLDATEVTDTFSTNETVTLVMTDTRRTYPTFSVPSTITSFIATHSASGKVVIFTRGAHTGIITINCADLSVVTAAGVNAQSTMGTLDFGMYHDTGAGTMSIVITGYGGSGTATVSIRERTEL